MRGAATHRLLAVGSGRLDQAVKLSAGQRAFERVAEQPVLASYNEGSDCRFCSIVVDRQEPASV